MTPRCPVCGNQLQPDEIDHTMCRACAELDMIRMMGGALALPDDWYERHEDEPT